MVDLGIISRTWILVILFGSNGIHQVVQGYGKSIKIVDEWEKNVLSSNCYKLHHVQYNEIIYRVCTTISNDKTIFNPFITQIHPLNEKEIQIKGECIIFQLLANKVVVLSNGNIAVQDHDLIAIVNIFSCQLQRSQKRIISRADGIIPHNGSLSTIHHTNLKRTGNSEFNRYFTAIKYYNEGNIIKEYSDISIKSGDLVDQGEFVDAHDGSTKYYFIQRMKDSMHVIDTFNSEYVREKSTPISDGLVAHSLTYGNLTTCHKNGGIECTLYDNDFNPSYQVQVSLENSKIINSHGISQERMNYHYIDVHNLLGGGALVIFCEEIPHEPCKLFYTAINAQGQLSEIKALKNVLNSDRAGDVGDLLNIYTFRPKIFEDRAEEGKYCIVIPSPDSINAIYVSVIDDVTGNQSNTI
ncbi:hypothetical protein QAD02_018481 [Eretmocerus hayati]|uniref:Uncharacterized protein n=1 Tax=Eretmocerus hayati TaxID=131215 RepID=A0ACC2PGI7_9HYME|nr:hypothetical protein QAD02_018481 [Eretmocerus hayati]